MIAEEEFQALLRLHRTGALKDAGQFHIATGLSLLCAELDKRFDAIEEQQREIVGMLRNLGSRLDE
jgi:hypothetical protein